MYFVNWQREISIEEKDGKKTVVKRNKQTKEFHEHILAGTYVAISLFVGHPVKPPPFRPSDIYANEGYEARRILSKIGILTPRLVEISPTVLVEEYVGEDLYRVLQEGRTQLAFEAGVLTGRLHNAGYVFTDNKAANFLIANEDSLVRTDLGFIQLSRSVFAQSMDIGSFLASIIDLEDKKYVEVQKKFFDGYKSETGNRFPYLSIVIRNILSLGLTSDYGQMGRNMLVDSRLLVGT